jgi:hypothetical protein
MSAVTALRMARAAGIELELDGDDLLLQAATPPPAAILDLLSANKTAIVALLRQPDPNTAVIDKLATIVDGDGGVPREWAEGYRRLRAMPPPADIPERDWQAMVDGAGRLLEQWGSKFACLEWTVEDVFGVHRVAPLARLDLAGLVRFLIRFEVVELTDERAILMNARGARHTYRRRRDPRNPEWTLLWDLGHQGAAE